MGNKSGNKSGIVLGIVLATIVLVAAIGGASAYDCDSNVNPGDSIQTAINNAAVGDTICVHAGTYSEWQIDVNKSLTLIGVDGMANVIVDGTDGSNYLMKVSVDEVTVSGFTLQELQSCSSGVMIVEGSHCNISYNDIHHGQAYTFKMSSGTDDNILKGNTIYYASCGCDGMFTIQGTNHVVTDNTIGQQGGAINVYCTGSLIYNNDFGTGISVPGTGNTWNTTYVSGENIIDGPYMGGSFYANYVGDDLYSGPNQDEPGSDGIGDTPYGEDKLPLVLYECGCVGATQTFTCGDTVTESCTFNADMTCTGVGLVVGAPDIVIDGGDDHKLIGSATSGDCVGADGANPCIISGIYNDGNDNVVIKNLEIERFCTGIAIKGTTGTEIRNNTVDNCEIHDNGFNTGDMATHGIHACDVDGDETEPGLTITNNDIYNNEGTGSGCQAGGNGVFIQAGGQDPKHEYCVISGNKLYDNAKAGFWTRMRLSKSDITFNNAWGNGHGTGVTDNVRGGIVLRCKGSNDNFVAHNEVSNNVGDGVGYGIYVGGNDNTIINNTANANTAVGICMGRGDGSRDNELRNNTVRMNDLDGIKVVYATATGNTLYDNTVCDNGQVSGVDIYDEDSTVGDRNRCDTGYNYNDTGAVPPNVCMYQCMEEQPDLIIEDIRPIRWCCYCIKPSRSLKGGDDDEGLSVMFIDDPELAKEFSDDELRKEVAEALAKDPKLATEISAKLAGDDKAAAKTLSDPKGLAERCCRCNAIKELADLLDTELTAEHQHEMSDQLDMIVGGGCCGGCCCNCLTTDCNCCCCGRFIAYKIANVGDTEAGFSLSNLTVNGRVRSVDIVRPLDAGQRRWEVFPCYRMWWWPRPHVVTVCADVTDWVAEGDETNNCRTEWFPSPYVTPGPTLKPIRALK